jgi:hypothetical protein
MKKLLTAKRIMIITACVVLAAAWGVRFYFVNKDIDRPILQVFEKGEEVPIGKDFYHRSDEDRNGYTFTVLDSELLTIADFMQKYEAADEQRELMGEYTDYVYAVRVSITNHYNMGGEQRGIDLFQTFLQGTDYYLMADTTCFQIANPNINVPGLSFSLRQDSSLEMVIPYGVMSDRGISIQHLMDDPPKLLISSYPHQKMLRVN